MGMKLQIRRGKKASLPALAPGELGLCTDTGEVFIGSENGNLPVGGAAGDMLKSVYDADGDGVVDKAESVPWAGVTGKPATYPATAHTHTKSQITDMPTSLPANGGNADTVDGKHAADFATAAQGEKADAALPRTGGTISGVRISANANETGDIVFDRPSNYTYEVHMDLLHNHLRFYGYDWDSNYKEPFQFDFETGQITAGKCVYDADGSAIKSTYIASIDTSGNTIRAKNKNGTVLYTVTPPFAGNASGCADDFFYAARNNEMYGGVFIGKYRSNGTVGLGLYNDGVNMFLTCIRAVQVGYINATGGGLTFQPLVAKAFNVSSSRRYKEHIHALTEDAARQLLALEPVQFDYINPDNGTDCFGLIAEDAYAVQPQGVSLADVDGAEVPDAIDYSAYVPQLIKLCQVQQAQIDTLEAENKALKEALAALTARQMETDRRLAALEQGGGRDGGMAGAEG